MSDDFDQDLRRAREHLTRATLEALEAARILLDVTLRASGLSSAGAESLTAELGRGLDALITSIRSGQALRLPAALAEPLLRGLEAEIARWEVRSRTEPDARPILRALLGLREMLWELGLRPSDESPPPRPSAAAEAPADESTAHATERSGAARATTSASRRESASKAAPKAATPGAPPKAPASRVQRFDVEG